MKLLREIWSEEQTPLPPDLEIHGLSLDSRKVHPGDLFFALQGRSGSGADYLVEVQAAGATAALIEGREMPVFERRPDFLSACVPNLRSRLSDVAARFFDHPASAARITAVTGTNGKTGTSYLAAALFDRLGHSAGYCGTLGFGRLPDLQPLDLTTPDAIEMQRVLKHLEGLGCSHVFVEVSSHALDQRRVEAVPFCWAVLTGLSRDHLDYHSNIESYWQAKRRLFFWPGLTHRLVNGDDARAAELAAEELDFVYYGCADSADIRLTNIRPVASGFRVSLTDSKEVIELELKLLGRGNLMNTLAAAGLAYIEGHSLSEIASVLPDLPPVPGRMQVFRENGRIIVVDYAHNPEALEMALQNLREHISGRLICVFGCGGNRDAGKRPLMGRIACENSDQVILTSDNPRDEDPNSILDDIESGCTDASVIRIPDRRQAVLKALNMASASDCVLITGRGHESHQIIRGQRLPLNDASLVSDWQRGRGQCSR